MEGIWILPAPIDTAHFQVALGKALQLFPPVAGRLRKSPDTKSTRGSLYIELTNDGVPVSVVDDEESSGFPFDTVGKFFDCRPFIQH